MARKPARRRKPACRTVAADPRIGGQVLRENGFVACDEEPTECRVSFNATGAIRRVHARYPNGWRCTLSLLSNGAYSLSQTIRLTTKPEPAS